jgi:hypothetical protein
MSDITIRTDALLSRLDIWDYEDLPMAWSSHKIPYNKLAYIGTNAGEVKDHYLSQLALAKQCGAEIVAWRTRPELKEFDDGTYCVYSRLHLLPREANERFWAGVRWATEGERLPRVPEYTDA